jgi:hypothetical protein
MIPGALNSMRAEARKTGDEDLAELADQIEQAEAQQDQ